VRHDEVKRQTASMDIEIIFDYIAPVIPVMDLDAALARYQALGFTVQPYTGGERYGFVERGGIHLHLVEIVDHDPGSSSTHVYLYVSDADSLRPEWATVDDAGTLSVCYDTPYGLREFSMIDSEGTLHRVGWPLSR
jgi:hypothetical protein